MRGVDVLRPEERTPPRPRPARDGEPLTEAELGQALRELRDTWAGLTQITLAKRAGLSDSAVSAHERGHGLPSTKALDKFVITCLQHRGLTPQQIIAELRYWHDARKALDLRRREHASTAPTPQPDLAPPPTPSSAAEPAPAPATLDGSTQQAAPEATNRVASPDPAPEVTLKPEGESRRGAGWTPRRRVMVVAAAIVVTVGVVGVIGLPGLQGPDIASGADRRSSPRAATPTQPLVDSPPYVAGATYSETVNSAAGARTYTNPSGMVGEGDRIPNHTTVYVSCKIVAPGGSSVGTYWYRITDPQGQDYYSPTNSFLNDDPIHGSHKKGVDEKVPYCPT